MATAVIATDPTAMSLSSATTLSNTSSDGIIHVFSSSYLGRLFKNPFPMANVAPFKSRPVRARGGDRYVLPDRPITGRACANCFDSSTLDEWIQTPADGQLQDQAKVQKSRLLDVLGMPSAAYKASYNFVKRMADVVYCAALDTVKPYPNVDDEVLASERVKEGIVKNVTRLMDDEDEDTMRSIPDINTTKSINHERQSGRTEILMAGERVRARSALRRMRAHICGWTMKFVGYILFKLLRLILRTVQILPDQIEKLKKASEANLPMIYLPNHRSHLDYVLISFTLAQFGFRAPYVAAGDNLDIAGFSWFLRSLGAFFIKRRLDKDYVYRAVLHTYIETLLKKGESVEFFMEAGRSRTGRPIIPKAGLLSVVVGTYLQGGMPNAYIVPVSVSYEKLIEGSFHNELMGDSKKKESFWGAITGIWNVFCTKYGSVRIDFGQPVTIQDYLRRLQGQLPSLPHSEGALAMNSIFEFCQQQRTKSMSSRMSMLSLLSGADSNVITDENRQLIKSMCNHIVYDFSQNMALMCTQLLAFLLTTKYRRGGRLNDIVDDFHWLCHRVLASGRDLGFSGDPRDVVRYALEILGPNLVTCEISDIDSGVGSDSGFACGHGGRGEKESPATESYLWLVKPTITLPYVLDLSYYAAPVSVVFLQEAIIANALLSVSLQTNKTAGDDFSRSTTVAKSPGTIYASKIIDRALALTDLLEHEFLFARPCSSLRQCLEQTLDRMVQEGLLVRRSCSNSASTPASSSYNVRFCLDKNQTYGPSSSTSSHGSSASLDAFDEDFSSSTPVEKPTKKQADGTGDAFYLASEDESADDEDDGEENSDEWFGRQYSSSASTGHRRSSYGIASLVENEDDYNADVIRLYASSLGPLLECYKFAIKAALTELTQPSTDGTLTKTKWSTEAELVRKLLCSAKEIVRGSSCQYAEFLNYESIRNAIRWLISKGIVLSSRDRLRLHDAYIDDPETLERFCAEIENLCVVVTY